MKSILFAITVLFLYFNNLQAQYRVGYQIEYIIDTINKIPEIEKYNLDIKNNQSIYYPKSYVILDSLIKNKISLHSKDTPESKLNHIVHFKNKNIEFEELLVFDRYKIKDDRKLKWKIISKSDTLIQIDSTTQFKAKVAKCYFAGRSWVAWFTNEIPINEGPYKFKGLPGLIIKLTDSKNEYSFNLISINKIKEPLDLSSFNAFLGSPIEISFSTFKEIVNKIENNDNYIKFQVEKKYNAFPPDLIKDFTDGIKKRRERANNPIELSKE